MSEGLVYYCRGCQRRFRVVPPLCARMCRPTPTEKAEAAAFWAALRCRHCGSAEVGPFHYREHDPMHAKRLRYLDRISEDNRSSYRADLAHAKRGVATLPEPLRCPRCREKVKAAPTAVRPCPECGGH